MNAQTVTLPKIIENSHADLAHGAWAERTRNACKQQGASQIWQEKTGTVHFLCFDPNFGWLDWIANKTKNAWEEATAFQPKDGTISSVVEWIKRKGAKWIPLEIFENTLR